MKLLQKITTWFLLLTVVCSQTMLGVQAGNLERNMQIAAKVEIMNNKLDQLISKYYSKMDNLIEKNKNNPENLKKIKTTIINTIPKIDKVLNLVKSNKYRTSIYRWIYIKQFSNFKTKLLDYQTRVNSLLNVTTVTNTTTVQTVKVWWTPEEKKEITTQKVIEILNTKTWVNWEKDVETLVANGLFTKLEWDILTLRSRDWKESFEFCANFTPDVYNNIGLRKFTWGNQNIDASLEYKAWKNKYVPNWWKKDYGKLDNQITRVQWCVSQLNGYYEKDWVDQKFIKALYEKVKRYEGKNVTFKIWEKPFYMDWNSTDDFERNVLNIDDYIKKHHGW